MLLLKVLSSGDFTLSFKDVLFCTFELELLHLHVSGDRVLHTNGILKSFLKAVKCLNCLA